MATTTNNGWTTPDDTGYVRDGALNIRTLGSAIDTSVGKGLLAWQTWAPTFPAGGWVANNGVWDAKYCQVGKTVFAYGYFTLGTTTTKGTSMIISLPVTARASTLGVGSAFCGVTSTSTLSTLHAIPNSTTSFQLAGMNVAGTYAALASVTGTVPISFTTGSVFSFQITYEAA